MSNIVEFIGEHRDDVPMFKKTELKYYKVLPKMKEGDTFTTILRVSYTVKPEFVKEGYTGSYWFIPLKCGTQRKLELIEKTIGNRVSCNFEEVKPFLMGGLLFNSEHLIMEELPIKGEEVICNFIMEDGIIKCNSVSLLPKAVLSNYKMKTYLNMKELFKEN